MGHVGKTGGLHLEIFSKTEVWKLGLLEFSTVYKQDAKTTVSNHDKNFSKNV